MDFLKRLQHISLLLFILLVLSGCQNSSEESTCRKHIELHSAKYYANELGRSEMSVLSSYKINLWQKETSHGKGRNVGKLIPGSMAVIISEGSEDYKVKSPLDKSIGWINKMHVNRTLFQDINTRESCNP